MSETSAAMLWEACSSSASASDPKREKALQEGIWGVAYVLAQSQFFPEN
jgi:hypothetical protein